MGGGGGRPPGSGGFFFFFQPQYGTLSAHTRAGRFALRGSVPDIPPRRSRQVRRFRLPASLLAVCVIMSSGRCAEPTALDRILREENATRKVAAAGTVDDLAFLRRVSVDLIGRIPS